jgi:UDP-sulfoquinovose synthase
MGGKEMKILLCGGDGYIGWALYRSLLADGHEVWVIDNGTRRDLAHSITPIDLNRIHDDYWVNMDVCRASLDEVGPVDVVYHLAQMPSAPYSLSGEWECINSYTENVQGNLALLWWMKENCPDAHLIKLGTMGEYGTPDCVIPEAGPHEFTRQPGSFYHSSKVADSVNCELASRIWGLKITDVNQGIVYGLRTDHVNPHDNTATRFDCDAVWGTVINRFCAQAVIGMPLTVYGAGTQVRGFLPLRESIRCLRLLMDNPAQEGEYRVFNQLAEWKSMEELAQTVADLTNSSIDYIPNPRVEAETHRYEIECEKLRDLGYKPRLSLGGDVLEMIQDLKPFADRIEASRGFLLPKVSWR